MRIESSLEAEANFPKFSPVQPRVVAAWDAFLRELWNSDGSADRAAAALYASEKALVAGEAHDSETYRGFLDQLREYAPVSPATPEERYRAVVETVRYLLRQVRARPAQPFLDDSLAAALRPIGRLHAGTLTSEVCAALYDYHRGAWTPYLTRAQRQKVQQALATALASLPPDEMEFFWENLHNGNALMRGALRLGLEWLTSDHAVPHLLCGLDRTEDSDTRCALVDNLARIGDPRALPYLYALRLTMAVSDWPLARRISTAIGVIEHLNRGRTQRSLLRPADAPPLDPAVMLRPASGADTAPATLLRSSEPIAPARGKSADY